ncbi:MAG: hypothetical protein ACI83P_000496 [Janthinobacterium sp.]|jgi:hypothetical protein
MPGPENHGGANGVAMHRILFSLIAATQFAALPSLAQDIKHDIKPGLWEVHNKMTSVNPETDQAVSMLLHFMGNLPPEQLQRVQEMATGQGLTMPQFTPGGGIGLKACVTPEMAASKQVPNFQQGECSSNNVAIEGGMKMAFVCSNPVSSGNGTLKFTSATHFTMKMNVTSNLRGKPEHVTVDSTGRWLGADCPLQPR